MAQVIIRLFDKGAAANRSAIELVANQASAGQPLFIQSLRVIRPGPVVVDSLVFGSPTLPASAVEDNGDGSLKLRRVDSLGFRADIAFQIPTDNTNFFAVHFDVVAGVTLQLQLELSGSAAAEQPVAYLTVLGRVRVNDNALAPVFSSVAIGYRCIWDELPAFPSTNDLGLGLQLLLPGLIPWPTLRIPFDTALNFPLLPNTIRLPAHTVPIASFPLKWGWDGVSISARDSDITVEIYRLRIVGLLDLFVSLRLTFKLTEVEVERIDGVEGFDLADIRFRQISDGCFGIDAKTKDLAKIPQLFTSEIPSTGDNGNPTDIQLRIHAPNRELTELRLDWTPPGASALELPLPGFALTLPTPQRLSLIAKPTADEDAAQLVMAATFATSLVTFATTFGWPLSDTQQEKLPDGAGKEDSKLALEFMTKGTLSIALFDIPLGGGGKPRFIRKLTSPLPNLEELETNLGADGEDDEDFIRGLIEPCPDTSLNTESLTTEDIDSINLTLPGTPYTFPFLKIPSGPDDDQYLQLLGFSELTADEISDNALMLAVHNANGFFITRKLNLLIKLGSLFDNINVLSLSSFLTSAILSFDVERMSFAVDLAKGIPIRINEKVGSQYLGLTFSFVPNDKKELFILVVDQRNYGIRQAPGSVIKVEYDKVTMPGDSIEFLVTDFAITPKGLNLTASITDKPARLNGLETQFRFTEGVLQIQENRIAGFTISGSGPLPPDLVGDAVADIGLQFGEENGQLTLLRGSAKIKGPKLLSCKATRFEFELDALGLNFVREGGADHLYFTLSGKARYVMQAGDDSSGPLAWLPGIEIQLVDCPLTGNARVIAKHVKFLIELPKKVRFDFLGCFTMEIRSIGFVPQFDKLADIAAMRIGGQIMLGDTGDLVDSKIDLHDLYVALPEPGSFIPRLYLKSLGIRIAQGDTFTLEANVDFYNGEEIQPGINAFGFVGDGSVTIKGLPPIAASMAWLRVSRDGNSWSRAWFIYLEAREMSLRIPVFEIYIREIGIGFGYRYTLAAFKDIDATSDVRKLLKKLKDISDTPEKGNLSKLSAWKVDLESEGEDPRWTVALRALFASSSAQKSPFTGYSSQDESILPSLYILDVVLAVRSDLTFFMAGRAWLNTNYHDFHKRKDIDIRNGPLLNGFMMLSPKQNRFLANLSSNPNAQFGDHPPVPEFVKKLLRTSKYTATLLVEPGLIHYELGWPNQLQTDLEIGPLTVEVRAGQIFRLSKREIVVGQSYLARGKLVLKADFSAGFFGASLSAIADVAYGMRYIGVIAFDDPMKNSAFYGAVGLDIRVQLQIQFWLRLKTRFFKISYDLNVDIEIQFTAALQIGITLPDLAGALGTATISVSIMGRHCGFNVRVGINDGAVESARAKTERFLNIGLEAENVEPIPGTSPTRLLNAPAPIDSQASLQSDTPANATHATSAQTDELENSASGSVDTSANVQSPAFATNAVLTEKFIVPEYNAGIAESAADPNTLYVFLMPASATSAQARDGFLAVPPNDDILETSFNDFEWTFPSPIPNSLEFWRWKAEPNNPPILEEIATGAPDVKWSVSWEHNLGMESDTGVPQGATIAQFLRYGYIYPLVPGQSVEDIPFGEIVPESDPKNYLYSSDRIIKDPRVSNPSSAAFEAAVRGAAEQFAAPYFKFDPNFEYDKNLLEACQSNTSIYTENGKVGDKVDNEVNKPSLDQVALELRSSLLQSIARDFFEYASLTNEESDRARAIQLRKESLLFRFGLIFKIKVNNPSDSNNPLKEAFEWLGHKAGKIRQRIDPAKPDLSIEAREITVFNRQEDWFRNRPPQFPTGHVKLFEHANTIAIDWRLEFPSDRVAINPTLAVTQDDPEHHLRHYLVRREHLDGNDPTVTFTPKCAEVLHRAEDSKDNPLLRLPPRFQLVDHFSDQNAADVAALTAEGKLYLYTITPVDIAGTLSERPLSVVARRLPCDPPLVPTDGELIVKYNIEPNLCNVIKIEDDLLTSKPILQSPESVILRFSDPVEPIDRPVIPVAKYRLVFRRESVIPVGFYGADENVRGVTNKVSALTNARPLRTDKVIDLDLSSDELPKDKFDPDRADSGRLFRSLKVDICKLKKQGIFAGGDQEWRPEGWTVFLQTETKSRDDRSGVRSHLAPIVVRIEFFNASDANKLEQRQFSRLEWIPKPVRLDLLPPEDKKGEVGFAKVPMPKIPSDSDLDLRLSTDLWRFEEPIEGEKTIKNIQFEQHPSRLRAVKVIWNLGPSGVLQHPIELYARYQVYEFDAFGNIGDLLRPTTDKYIDFPKWSRQAELRAIQEVDLVPAKDLANTPGNINDPQSWEAWYPGSSRRLVLKKIMQRDGKWPDNRDTTYGPWYSFRDSYLVWPDTGGLLMEDVRPQRLRGFHPFLEDVAALLGRTLVDQKQPGYDIEFGTQPSRGSNQARENIVEVNPVKMQNPPDALEKLMQSAPAETDPYGWSLLQRMGLATGIRMRQRADGEYLKGVKFIKEIHEAIQRASIKKIQRFRALDGKNSLRLRLQATKRNQFYRVSTNDDGPVFELPYVEQSLQNVSPVVITPFIDIDPLVKGSILLTTWTNTDLERVTVKEPPEGEGERDNRGAEMVESVQRFGALDGKKPLRLRLQATAPDQFYKISSNDNEPVLDLQYLEQSGQNVSPVVVTPFIDPFNGGILLTTWTKSDLERVTVMEPVEPPEGERDNRGALIEPEQKFDFKPFLHVEYLFQPGKRLQIKPTELENAGIASLDDTLSMIQLSLRPSVQQLYRYERYILKLKTLPANSDVSLTINLTGKGSATYIVDSGRFDSSGRPMTPATLNSGDNSFTFPASMSGTLALIVRVVDADKAKGEVIVIAIKGVFKSQDGNTVEVLPEVDPLAPIDWPSVNFTVPDDPLKFANDEDAQNEWNRFNKLLRGVEPAIDASAETLSKEKIPLLLSWLDRFFGTGGDIVQPDPTDRNPLAKTADGPWVASAYPRTMAPLPLTPDAAGRLTYYRPIESLWGQACRYLVRPRGRYELLWEELGRSRKLELDASETIETLQKRLKAPEPGGVDVILPRIRPLAAPMVLSSRRLDLPSLPGSASPPGKIWEVLLAEHPEQELIDRNRPLVHRLEYRQMLQALFRSFVRNDHTLDQVNQLMAFARSRRYHADDQDLVSNDIETLYLSIGQGDHLELDVRPSRTLTAVCNLIKAAAPSIDCKVLGESATGKFLQLKPKSGLIPELALRTGKDLANPDQDLLTKPLDTRNEAIQWPESPKTNSFNSDLPKLSDYPEELTLNQEGLVSIDLPLRSSEFSRGTLAVQYDALPFYYRHRMLIVAQAAHVVSAITSVEQQDFEYESADTIAVMEAAQGPAEFSARSIRIPLARLWDSLPQTSQKMWGIEDPKLALNNKILPGGLIDTSTIYSIVIQLPGSGNVQLVAEYRFDKTITDDFPIVSVPLPGPFTGMVVRVETVGTKERPILETLLLPKVPTPTFTYESISSRSAISVDDRLLQWPANENAYPHVCELRTMEPATDQQVAALRRLMLKVDVSFAEGIRTLLATSDQASVATTSVGLEQLREIHDGVQIDETRRTITWTGPLTVSQQKVFEEWEKTSLFAATLISLRNRIQAGGAASFTVDIEEEFWKSRSNLLDDEPLLRNYLAIANGVIGIQGIMTRKHANELLALPSLSLPDKQSVRRLYRSSLQSELGGGELRLLVRRGSANTKSTDIGSDL
jgi:hypothetical protein